MRDSARSDGVMGGAYPLQKNSSRVLDRNLAYRYEVVSAQAQKGIDMDKDLDELLSKWHATKTELTKLQEEEKNLRLQVKLAFFGDEIKKGTEKIAISDGWNLKCVHKINRSFPDKAALNAALAEISAVDESTATNIVRWTPSLSESVYETTTLQIRTLIDKVMVSKPGMPSIEIEKVK